MDGSVRRMTATELFGGDFRTPYDLYLSGKTYGEIATELDMDLFEVMNEVANQAAARAAWRRQHPQEDYEFAIYQLKKVITQAWEDHGSVDERGNTKDSLSTIVSATKALVTAIEASKQLPDEKEKLPQLPTGLNIETVRQLARLQVQAKFHKEGR